MNGKRTTSDGNRQPVSLRVLPEELADIDQRAKRLRLTRTDYMVRAALRQPLGDEDTEERLDALAVRVERLEHYQGLSA